LAANIDNVDLVMSEQQSQPIPDDVREAFRDAIHSYKSGSSERSVSFRRLMQLSLGGVCDLVLSYRNEPLPLSVHDELWNLLDEIDLKVELAKDPSYATGARCLDKLIRDHRAGDRQPEARHHL
jgi:hypothetical protein